MRQLDYVSKTLNRDIKPVNFVSPRGKDPQNKVKTMATKKFLSAYDVLKIALFVVVIVNLWNHVSIRFH